MFRRGLADTEPIGISMLPNRAIHHGVMKRFSTCIAGQYEIQCGDRTVRAGPGSFVFAPREIPHKLTNVSTGPSIVLGIVSPAGFEGFWEEISRLAPPEIDKIMAIAKKYGLEIHAP
jgi:mannose-6-phosphate isomerase-like protein (cupin superfamily)